MTQDSAPQAKRRLAAIAARWNEWSAGSSSRRIFSASLLVGSIAGCVSLVGLGREAIVARTLGLGDEVDAFVLALALATLPVSMIAGSFQSVLIPAVLSARRNAGVPAARRVAAGVLGRTMLWLCATMAVFAVLLPLVLPLLASGFSADKRALTFSLFLVLLPGLFLAGVATVLGGILQAAEEFAPAALSPVSVHLLVLACLLGWSAQLGAAHALAVGTVLGYVAQAIWLGLLVRARGLSDRPALHGSRSLTRGAVPLSLWIALHSTAHAFVLGMAAALGPGAVAAFNYAMKLPGAIAGMAAGALTQASLPYLSRHVVGGDWLGLRRTLGIWTRIILLGGLPLAVGLALFSEQLVSWMFQGGAFSAADSRVVGWVQAALFVQVPFFVLTQFQSRVLIAVGSHRRLAVAGALLLALTVLWGVPLCILFGTAGLGASTAAAFACVAAWYSFVVGRAIGTRAGAPPL